MPAPAIEDTRQAFRSRWAKSRRLPKSRSSASTPPNINAILFNLLLHSHELSDGRRGGGWIRVQREVVPLDHTNLN